MEIFSIQNPDRCYGFKHRLRESRIKNSFYYEKYFWDFKIHPESANSGVNQSGLEDQGHGLIRLNDS